jgi:hypothetical protein
MYVWGLYLISMDLLSMRVRADCRMSRSYVRIAAYRRGFNRYYSIEGGGLIQIIVYKEGV